MITTINKLESQGIRFAPRRLNGIDRFDYDGNLSDSQAAMIRELKRDEAAVCRYLVERAKGYIEIPGRGWKKNKPSEGEMY